MESCELLISEVQKRSALWNKRNKKYRDRLFCDKEWSIVAKKTNLDSECKINKYILQIEYLKYELYIYNLTFVRLSLHS